VRSEVWKRKEIWIQVRDGKEEMKDKLLVGEGKRNVDKV
jgi:hypothetical protein